VDETSLQLKSVEAGVVEVVFATASATQPVTYTVYYSPSSKNTVMYSLCGLRESAQRATAVVLPAAAPAEGTVTGDGMVKFILKGLQKGA